MPVESSNLCVFEPFSVSTGAVRFAFRVFKVNSYRAQNRGYALIDSAARFFKAWVLMVTFDDHNSWGLETLAQSRSGLCAALPAVDWPILSMLLCRPSG